MSFLNYHSDESGKDESSQGEEFSVKNENDSTFMRLRAHRDELISLENELGEKLQLKSDGSLFKTPI